MVDRRRAWLLAALVAAALGCAAIGWNRCARRDPDPPSPTDVDRAGSGPATPVPARRLSKPWPEPSERLAIVGVVVDADGEPVADAIVRLGGRLERDTTSTVGGKFAFDDLPPGRYTLIARHEGAASLPRSALLERDAPPIVLRLLAAARLQVVVLDAGSRAPIAGARVAVRTTSIPDAVDLRTAVTGADGVAEMEGLPPGTYSVAASAPRHRAVEVPLPAQAGLTWSALVALPGGARVRGRVVDDRGAPVANADIVVVPGGELPALIGRRRPGLFPVTSAADGSFEIAALEAGRFRLLATHPSHLPGLSEPFESDGESSPADVVVAVERGASIAGAVVDGDGVPAPRAVVRANAVDFTARGSGVVETVTGDDGRFRLDGLPAIPVQVVAATAYATSDEATFDLAAAPTIDDARIELVFDAVLGGTVTDGDGAPIGGAHVVCVGEPRGAIGTRPVAPIAADDDGRFLFRGLAPGSYELTAMRPDPNNNVSPWRRSGGAPAEAGDLDVRIVIPGDGRIEGIVVGPGGAPVSDFYVGLDSSGAPRPFSDPRGQFALEGIPPLTYDVELSAPGIGMARVEGVVVPEGGTADIGRVTLER